MHSPQSYWPPRTADGGGAAPAGFFGNAASAEGFPVPAHREWERSDSRPLGSTYDGRNSPTVLHTGSGSASARLADGTAQGLNYALAQSHDGTQMHGPYPAPVSNGRKGDQRVISGGGAPTWQLPSSSTSPESTTTPAPKDGLLGVLDPQSPYGLPAASELDTSMKTGHQRTVSISPLPFVPAKHSGNGSPINVPASSAPMVAAVDAMLELASVALEPSSTKQIPMDLPQAGSQPPAWFHENGRADRTGVHAPDVGFNHKMGHAALYAGTGGGAEFGGSNSASDPYASMHNMAPASWGPRAVPLQPQAPISYVGSDFMSSSQSSTMLSAAAPSAQNSGPPPNGPPRQSNSHAGPNSGYHSGFYPPPVYSYPSYSYPYPPGYPYPPQQEYSRPPPDYSCELGYDVQRQASGSGVAPILLDMASGEREVWSNKPAMLDKLDTPPMPVATLKAPKGRKEESDDSSSNGDDREDREDENGDSDGRNEDRDEADYVPQPRTNNSPPSRPKPARAKRPLSSASLIATSLPPAKKSKPSSHVATPEASDFISPRVLATASQAIFGVPPGQLTASQKQQCITHILTKRSRNTEAARRSREKRRDHVEELEERVKKLEGEKKGLQERLDELEGLLRERM